MFGFIEKVFEAFFLIRAMLKAQGHNQADLALVAYDSVNGAELAREVVVHNFPVI